MPIDELSPEEVLEWASDFHRRQRAKKYEHKRTHGTLLLGPDQQLIEFKVMKAEMEANIAIVRKAIAALDHARADSIDKEIALRVELAEFEGMSAKMDKLIEDVKARIDASRKGI